MAYRGYVSVDVDINDVLGEMSDSDLIEELRSRSGAATKSGFTTQTPSTFLTSAEIDELSSAVRSGRKDDALALIDRISRPKFHDPSACLLDYKKSISATVAN